MNVLLVIALIAIDLILIGAIIWLSRRQSAGVDVALEITEERRLLTELRASIQEELEATLYKARETFNKATKLAAEAELEVKNGGQLIAAELDLISDNLIKKFEKPLEALSLQKAGIESILRLVDQEKAILKKLLSRGEKICQFFDERIPYEDVLHEIEDKKYTDARKLLALGHTPHAVARELDLSESEVRIVAGLSPL